jgi:hypothetical protein
MKRQATYVYTYNINTPNIDLWGNDKEALPFLFDSREQTSSEEYLECDHCGEKYPYPFSTGKQKIDLTILQKAIRADNKDEPEFFG